MGTIKSLQIQTLVNKQLVANLAETSKYYTTYGNGKKVRKQFM